MALLWWQLVGWNDNIEFLGQNVKVFNSPSFLNPPLIIVAMLLKTLTLF